MRAIHERLYFRPLLEAFATEDEEVLSRPGAIEARLQAFGFSDGLRTRAAVRESDAGLDPLIAAHAADPAAPARMAGREP